MHDPGGGQVTARKGFFPVVIGRDVHVEDGGAIVHVARRDLTLWRGGGQWLVAGRDQTIQQGGGAVLLSRHARVTGGFVGVAIAGRLSMDRGARALMTLPMSAAAAVAVGVVVGFLVGRASRA